jgi:hypothetical protein
MREVEVSRIINPFGSPKRGTFEEPTEVTKRGSKRTSKNNNKQSENGNDKRRNTTVQETGKTNLEDQAYRTNHREGNRRHIWSITWSHRAVFPSGGCISFQTLRRKNKRRKKQKEN